METLTALVPLGVSLAVMCVCFTLVIGIAAAIFGGLELEGGSEKYFMLKMRKRQALLPAPTLTSAAHPSPEPIAAADETPHSLSHEPIPQAPDTQPEVTGTAKEGNPDAFWNYVIAKNLNDLDAAFDPMIAELEPDQVEFWHTDYLQRRERFGADRARDAMRDLSAQQPSWAYPHAILLEWALEDHDVTEAKKQLDTGLSKSQSPQFGFVLSGGVRLIFKVDGKQAALAFACQWSRADLPESLRASALVTLADLLKDAGDTEGFRVALEFASAIQPSSRDRAFSLAYSYAEANGRWAQAIWHYQRCLGNNESAVARNNVGIIYSQIDKAVAVQTYEKASADGDKYASANLAHLLVEDGYISIAQSLLDSVEDPGSAAENHAAARKAALTAKRNADAKLAQITEAARLNMEPYKASLAAALRNLQRGEPSTVVGFFASEDRNAIAMVDGAKAFCQLRLNNVVLEGPLIYQVTCFTGWMSTKGGGLLTSELGQFTLLNEGDGVLRLFRWPSEVGLQHRVAIYELRQVPEAPELAPPPPPPTPARNVLANALLQLPNLTSKE